MTCKYCERVGCDTDCAFADAHLQLEPRKTAREFWNEGRSVMLAEITALKQRLAAIEKERDAALELHADLMDTRSEMERQASKDSE